MALFFFVLSAVPAVVVSGVAVLAIDSVLGDEIARRTDEVSTQMSHLVQHELAKSRAAIVAFSESDELRRGVLEPLARGELASPEELNALVTRAERSAELEVFALADLRGGGEGTILASAHYPASAESPAPAFARLLPVGSSTVGFAHELTAGNPPLWAPVLVAAVSIPDAQGRPFVLVWGGVRLDTHRLQAIAASAHARLDIDSPGLPAFVFPVDADTTHLTSTSATLVLPRITGGRAQPGSVGMDAGDDPTRPSRILVRVDTRRLETARTTFTAAAAVLVVVWLLLAPLAGRLLARPITEPIVELADAAQKIGAGDLGVKLVPRTNDEVGTLVEVFNRMTSELAESRQRLQRAERVAAWREIARRVAHEIKNPLFPIQMSMETLRKGWRTKHPKLEEIVEESTKTVLEEVRALNRIVTEFSDFARLPAPKLERANIGDLLEHTRALYAGGATRANVEVRLDHEALRARALPELALDREQIARALINLVKNAVEALPEAGGVITLDAEPEARGRRRGLAILVHDTGPGIPEEIRAQIFTPYFTTKQQGTGLGLAIVERIAEEHHGTVGVTSEPGRGTTFRVWLPLDPSELEA